MTKRLLRLLETQKRIISMPVLAARLSRYLQCPGVDKTKLKDSYDFKFEYHNNNPNA